MPMFGSQFGAQQQQAMTPPIIPDQRTQAQPMRKRGLFGGMADYLGGESGTPGINRLATIGATLKDIGASINGGDSDNLAMMQQIALKRAQDAQAQQWQQKQQGRQEQDWRETDIQKAALKQWATTLPDGPLKELAQYDPTTAYEVYAKQQTKGTDWQVNKYSGQTYGVGADGQPIVGGYVPNWQSPPRSAGAQGPQLGPDEEWD